jgi:hypothetical protein
VLKKICLIKDERPLWAEVEKYLGGVNAQLLILSGQPDGVEIVRFQPNLIIANARAHHELSHRIRKFPVIVLKEGTPPVALVRDAAERNLMITGWPLQRGQFLEITSRMLSVAPRRVFRTLIRIFAEGESQGSLGQSKDFSRSGVAFKTERTLKRGEQVTISFSLPEESTSLRLGAEIVRVTPDQAEGSALYGARFTALTAEKTGLLNNFIMS